MACRLLDDAGALLGEGPVWVSGENALYWVDIKGRRLNRYKLADGAIDRWSVHDNLAWVVPRRGGGWIAGLRHEIGELSLNPELSFEPRLKVEPESSGNRLNDAKTDCDGSILFGTMDDEERSGTGAFYHLRQDFTLQKMDKNYVIANGPAVSADGKIIYHTDSALRTIYRFSREADGTLGARIPFIRFADSDGFPDGMTLDAQGGLWVAHWGGGRVSRFDAEGRLDQTFSLPVSQVTSCCFGGANLDRLFITSAAIGLSPAQRAREPLAGGLFEITPGFSGFPLPDFTG